MSSSEPVLEILDWRPVAETLAAIQAECAQSEALVEELFSELEKRSTELAQKASEVELHRREAEERRRELAQEREENRRLSEQFETWSKSLETRLAAMPAAGPDGEPRPATDLELERAALVAELEQVRARAAELHETLLEQQQEHAEQIGTLAGEIQSLRQWIERNAGMREASPREVSPRDAAAQAPESELVSPASSSVAPGADPVVSSVMAQFAQLQRDVAKRRKRK